MGALAVVGVLSRRAARTRRWRRSGRRAGRPRGGAGQPRPRGLAARPQNFLEVPGVADHPALPEGVAWVVLAEPLTLSAAQIDAFGAIYPNNRRPVQPLGERVLWRG